MRCGRCAGWLRWLRCSGYAESADKRTGKGGCETGIDTEELTTDNESGEAGMRLEALAVALPEVAGHPNRVPFEGVLTLVDEPSNRPPSGARGHRVILTRAAA